jgi:hypothetical protein
MSDKIIDGLDRIIERVQLEDKQGTFTSEQEVIALKELLQLNQEQSKDITEKYSNIIDKHIELLKQYSLLVDEMGKSAENLLCLMLDNPNQALNLFVHQIDRKKKIADQSGDSWKRSLVLPFKSRFMMAIKLILKPA